MKLSELYPLVVSEQKISKYLLSPYHIIGKHKAIYFSQFGFTLTNSNLFIENIKELVNDAAVKRQYQNKYGTVFIVEGKMNTPINISISVRTVWIVLKNHATATFVTAYPV